MERQSHISPDLVCLMTARLSGCWRHSMNLRQVRPKHQVLSVSHDTKLLVIYCTSNNKNVVSHENEKKKKNILLNYFWPGSYRKRTNLGKKNPTTNNNILWSRSLVEQNASFFLKKKKKTSWKKCFFFKLVSHMKSFTNLQIYIYKFKSTQFPRWTDI